MSMRTEAVMVEIVQNMAEGAKSLHQAAEAAGIKSRTFWTWMRLSKDNDPQFLIRWPSEEDEPIQFWRAIAQARRVLALEVRSKFEAQIARGYCERESRFQGAPVYAPHPGAFDNKQRELLIMLGECDEEGYRLNNAGERVPVTDKIEVPAAILLAYMRTHHAEFRDVSTVNQNVNVNGTLGVASIGASRKIKDGPPVIPPEPQKPRVVEVVKYLPAPEPIKEAVPDPELSMTVSGTQPLVDEDYNAAPATKPPPPVVIREPAPAQYQPTGSPRSPLEADLLARLRGDPSKRSASPVGSTLSTEPRTQRPA